MYFQSGAYNKVKSIRSILNEMLTLEKSKEVEQQNSSNIFQFPCGYFLTLCPH